MRLTAPYSATAPGLAPDASAPHHVVESMTTPSNPPEPGDPDTKATQVDEARARIEAQTVKIVRRVGYVVFGTAALYVFVPMIIGTAMGIHQDRIWDPFTGQPLTRSEVAITCLDDAQLMMVEAGKLTSLTSGWEAQFRHWVTRCRREHSNAYDMLRATRSQLRGDSASVRDFQDEDEDDATE